MGDDHDGDAEFLVDLIQKLQNGGSGLRIQCTGGFVTKQDLRIGGQGSGDRHSLHLAARKLCRIRLLLIGKTYDLQQFCCLFPGFGFFLSLDIQGEAYVFQHGFLHQQIKMLEDHSDILPLFTQFLFCKASELLPVDQDFSFRGDLQIIDAADEGTLARAGHSDDPEDITGGYFQTYILKGLHGTIR